MSDMSNNGNMIFPPAWCGDQFTDAEEAEHEAKRAQAEEDTDYLAWLEELPESHNRKD